MLELLGFAVALLALGGGNYYLKQRRREIARHHRPAINRYRAVTINHSLMSCKAVSAFDDKCFLASEAPSLPVRGCDAWPCRCRYVHLPDRRAEERRSLYGSKRNLVPHSISADRRHSDRRGTSYA